MNDGPALSFEDVALVMDESRVLDAVSFDLPRGATLGIVGESGSGKTRIARIAAGLAAPTSGRVSAFGRRVADGFTASARIGMTLQGGSLFDELSIDDNLQIGSGVTSAAGWRALAGRVDRLLYEFGLAELGDVPAGALPIGAKRQLEVVRALLRDPDLLILDEPFEGAAAHLASMADAIRRSMRRRGGAILLLTENAALADALVDDRLRLRHGRIVQQGESFIRPAATSPATAAATAPTLA